MNSRIPHFKGPDPLILFHDDKNHHSEQMVADLIKAEFDGQSVKTVRVDPETQRKEVVFL